MRKPGMNAGLILGLGELVFHFAAFLVDHIQGPDGHTSKGLTFFRYPIAEREVISSIKQRCK